MRDGLVRYIGKRRGKFMQKVGRYPMRTWCVMQPHHEKWLPEKEAVLWERSGPWRVVRWRETDDPEPVVAVAAPAPPAVHVATALDQATTATAQAEEKRELVDATFVLSDSGVVHAHSCKNAPRRPAKTFGSLERAMADEEFNRAHQSCCRKHLKVLLPDRASVKTAVAQINALGEGLGHGQDSM